MVQILVKGTKITLPNSSGNPNWAPSVIEAFQALADAVNTFSGSFDVAPQIQSIDAFNPGSDIPLDNLVFPASQVRGATIYYTVYRKTTVSGPPDGMEVSEDGTLEINFNDSRPSGQKWAVTRESGGEDTKTNFDVTDLGQVEFSTDALTGINHIGTISYRAVSILNT